MAHDGGREFMRVDESSCDLMKVEKGPRWFMMVGESS